MAYPKMLHVVIDAADCRGTAEFWRELLGLRYRDGDEPPESGEDDADWLVLVDDRGERVLAIQLDEDLKPSTWPDGEIPMQVHLDFTVDDVEELAAQHARALELGATEILDRTDDPDEPLWVLADPAGHPFCIFVA